MAMPPTHNRIAFGGCGFESRRAYQFQMKPKYTVIADSPKGCFAATMSRSAAAIAVETLSDDSLTSYRMRLDDGKYVFFVGDIFKNTLFTMEPIEGV